MGAESSTPSMTTWAILARVQLTDILPRLRLPVLPSLRGKNRRVGEDWGYGRVQISPALHNEGAITNRGILQDCERRLAIGSATMGKSGVLQSKAYVEWDARIQTERLMHYVLFTPLGTNIS